MLPPEGLKDWFDKMEAEQLSMLDKPGGWNTRSRRYRITFAIGITVLLIAEVVLLNTFLFGGLWSWIVTGLFSLVIVVWVWILAFNPSRAFRMANWRGNPRSS